MNILIFMLGLSVLHLIECNDYINKKYYSEDDDYSITVNKLPLINDTSKINDRLMPFIGNGHLATTLFDKVVYMNGLYNGYNGESHRAAIPSIHDFLIKNTENCKSRSPTNRNYTINFKYGVFIERVEDDCVYVERRVFAHYYYTRLLVSQVFVRRKNVSDYTDYKIPIEYHKDYLSLDLDLKEVVDKDGYKLLSGHTKHIEFEEFQENKTPIFMYFIEPIETIVLSRDETQMVKTFVSSIDMDDASAFDEFIIAWRYIRAHKDDDLYIDHLFKFSSIWDYGRIQVDNIELQKIIYASYYFIISSLPSLNYYGTSNQFYGLSPGSLSRGAYLADYQGHSFWDTEIWMYPSVLMFYPDLAKQILSYRIHTAEAADYNAKLFNCTGWRFPWESAYTGVDVTPDCCPEVRLYQLHISGDIAFAARQYISATNDLDWLKDQGGFELIDNIAQFWSSRISYNQTKKQYELIRVLPPDEDAQPFVNNSIYTNIVAALSVYFANYTRCLLNKGPVDIDALNKARCLYLPYDKQNNLHLEYENYKLGTEIKQADVVLVGFPLLWPMEEDIRLNDLLYYENVTRPTGPAMTWSMHAIGHMEIGDSDRANDLFEKSFSIYTKDPFKIWTEAQDGLGAVNFITGAGGFLQALLFGYGGLRLKVDVLEILGNMPLPPNSTHLYLHNIKYLNSYISLNYTENNISLRVNVYNTMLPLELITDSQIYKLKDDFEITLAKVDYVYEIRQTTKNNCPLPYDKIDRQTC